MCSPLSASPPPEFARLDNGDALKLAVCEEVLVDSDQDRCASSDGGTENWNVARVTANFGRQVSRRDRGRYSPQYAAQLADAATR